MARMRTSNLLTWVGVLLLAFVVAYGYVTIDAQRRDAVDEARALREQTACTNELNAQALDAILAWLVAAQEGDGTAVAKVDAQLATQRYIDGRERCGLD